MTPFAIARVSLALAATALPGVVLASRLVPARRASARVGLGALVGLALASIGARLAPAFAGPWLLAGLVVLALAVVALVPGEPARRPRLARPDAFALAFALLLALQAASWVALELRHELPRGFDPSFHCLLVDRVLAGEVPATWEPWEPVRVNYTLGVHALLAHVCRLARVPPHEAFEASYGFLAAVLALETRELARTLGLGRVGALGAAAAVAFVAYPLRELYDWGGLATLLGAAAIVAAFGALARVRGRRGLALGAGLLAWLWLAHHLSALLGIVSVAGAGALLWRTRRELARRLVGAAGLAAVFALPLVPGYLGGARTLGATSVFRFADEPVLAPWKVPGEWGSWLVVLAALGIVVRSRRSGRGLALAWLAVLVAAYVSLDYVYREAARFLTGQDFSAFTPSRWRMLAALPLALLAGLGVRGVAARVVGRRRARARALALAIPFLAPLPLAPFLVWELRRPSVDPEWLEVGRWVHERTPEDALVIVDLPRAGSSDTRAPSYWFPYLIGRETSWTPLPASEPRLDPRVLEKEKLLDPDVRARVLRRRGKRAFLLHVAGAAPLPEGRWKKVDARPPLILESGESPEHERSR